MHADCDLCPRLARFRSDNRQKFEEYFNDPVPSFGALDAQLLVVGLAPGLHGANQTGRPFTGDYAGKVLYGALQRFGFAHGNYGERADDGFALINTRITNAVRCVPPENKPETIEIKTCNRFLKEEIGAMPNLRVILSLGSISHGAVLAAFAHKVKEFPFKHGGEYAVDDRKIKLVDSYHTTRYNINTNRLTVEMFDKIMARVKELVTGL